MTNYVEKRRLLSADYKSPSNGQVGGAEERGAGAGAVESRKKRRQSKTSGGSGDFLLHVDGGTWCQLLIPRFLNYRDQQPRNCPRPLQERG